MGEVAYAPGSIRYGMPGVGGEPQNPTETVLVGIVAAGMGRSMPPYARRVCPAIAKGQVEPMLGIGRMQLKYFWKCLEVPWDVKEV